MPNNFVVLCVRVLMPVYHQAKCFQHRWVSSDQNPKKLKKDLPSECMTLMNSQIHGGHKNAGICFQLKALFPRQKAKNLLVRRQQAIVHFDHHHYNHLPNFRSFEFIALFALAFHLINCLEKHWPVPKQMISIHLRWSLAFGCDIQQRWEVRNCPLTTFNIKLLSL